MASTRGWMDFLASTGAHHLRHAPSGRLVSTRATTLSWWTSSPAHRSYTTCIACRLPAVVAGEGDQGLTRILLVLTPDGAATLLFSGRAHDQPSFRAQRSER